MSTTVQFRRGTSVQNQAFRGAAGEITIDMDTYQLRVHDGVTYGGHVISGGSTGGGGSVTSINVSGGTTGFQFTGGPIASNGTITMTGNLNVAGGGTGTSNPVMTASGPLSVTGTWPNVNVALGTVGTANGGTGVNLTPGQNQFLMGDGTKYNLTTISAGTGVNFDQTNPGVLTINSTGGSGGSGNNITLADLPPGTIQWFAMQAPPTGWLECDGRLLSKVSGSGQYAALWTAIGYTYGGSGDNFNIPDLRGQFLRGWDHGAGIDTGRAFGSTQADDFKSHTHSITNGNAPINMAVSSGNTGFGKTFNYTDTGTSPIVATGGTETRPKNVAMIACIKYTASGPTLQQNATVNLVDFMNARYGANAWSYRTGVGIGTDAGPAINDALQYIRTNFSRGTLLIPPTGIFLINTPINATLLAGNNILGYGSQASKVVYNVNNSTAFNFTGSGGFTGGGIKGLGILLEAGIGTNFATGKRYSTTNAINLQGDTSFQPDQMVFSDLYVSAISAAGYDTSYWNNGLQIYGVRVSPQGIRVGQWDNIQLFNNYNAGIYIYNGVQHSFNNIGIYTGENNGNNCYITGGGAANTNSTQINMQNLTVSGELNLTNSTRVTINGGCGSLVAGTGFDYYDVYVTCSGSVNTSGIGANGRISTNGKLTGVPQIKLAVGTTTATNLASTYTWYKLTYNTVNFDPDNAYSVTNNRYTVPAGAGGVYLINVSTNCRLATAGEYYDVAVYKNGTAVSGTFQGNSSESTYAQATAFVLYSATLAAGDYIEIWGKAESSTAGRSANYIPGATNWVIHKLS